MLIRLRGLRENCGNGAPGEIGSSRLAAILGSSARRRFVLAPKTLSRFVGQEFSSDLKALLAKKGSNGPLFVFGAPETVPDPI